MLKEIEGDIVKLAQKGFFDVIAQGNNCFCVQGAGLAPQYVKAFGTDKFPLEDSKYEGDYHKLGNIDWKHLRIAKNGSYTEELPGESFDDNNHQLIVVNCYSQYGFGINHSDGSKVPLDYEALSLCLRKMNYQFRGLRVGLPMIGCGLAGGNEAIVRKMIEESFPNCDVTLVIYKP